jgi:histidinol phosphatase-like enzyme
MIYVFDLDGTLCETPGRDYAWAVPLEDRIRVVRRLHAEGHHIVIDSARGSVTGHDWLVLTTDQLTAWGVPFDELRVGVKFYGDVYVDDKGAPANAFFSEA